MKLTPGITLLLMLSMQQSAWAQHKVIKQMTSDICSCIDTISLIAPPDQIMQRFSDCAADSYRNRSSSLKKEYGALTSETQKKIEELVIKSLYDNCEKTYHVIGAATRKDEKPFYNVTADSCTKYHIGKYKVKNTNKIMEFSKDEWIEYNEQGSVYTEYHITWTSHCEFDARLKKSQNQNLEDLFKDKSAVLKMQLVDITPEQIVYHANFKGIDMHFTLLK